MNSKWIVFDAWGVIYPVGNDIAELLTVFVWGQNPDMDPDIIAEHYVPARVGDISAAEFWDRLGFGDEYPEIQQDYLNSFPTIDPQFAPVAERLARQYSLALLSNDLDEWSRHLRERFDIDRLFRVTVVSGEARVRKPDRAIFEELLTRTGAQPNQCVFIDDRPHNLRAAADMGFKTVRFDRGGPEDGFAPDATIRSFDELPAVAERLLAQDETGEA